MNKALAPLTIVFASLALVACGGDDNGGTTATTPATGGGGGGGGGGKAQTLNLSADPNGQLKFDTDKLSAKAGKVAIDLDNPAPIAHDVAVEQAGKDLGVSSQVTQSKTSLTLNLKPGTYTFYCSVDQHREGGMEGTLTVK